MKNIALVFVAVLMLAACDNSTKMKQQLIDAQVKETIESYKKRRYEECMTAIIDSANIIADSLIVLKMTAMDSSLLMGKPVKPPKPVFKSPLDTTPVKPIIPKN